MARHLLTKILAAGGLAVAVASYAPGDARAFTETATPTPAPAVQPAPSKDTAAPKMQFDKAEEAKGLTLTMPDNGKSTGTEVSIPGIGTVGVLPKLDFGLELLYGSGGDAAPEPADDKKDGDVQIKGTIKHHF